MNKAELIGAIADKADCSKAQAETMLNATLAVISETLAQGGDITLVGFGRFHIDERAARTGRNPKTGEAIEIPAAKVVKFSPGKELKGAVNG